MQKFINQVRLWGEGNIVDAVKETMGDFNAPRFIGVNKRAIIVMGGGWCPKYGEKKLNRKKTLEMIRRITQNCSRKNDLINFDMWFIGMNLRPDEKDILKSIKECTGGRVEFPDEKDKPLTVKYLFRRPLNFEPTVDLSIYRNNPKITLNIFYNRNESTILTIVENIGTLESKESHLEVYLDGIIFEVLSVPRIKPNRKRRSIINIPNKNRPKNIEVWIKQDKPDANPTNDKFSRIIEWEEPPSPVPPPSFVFFDKWRTEIPFKNSEDYIISFFPGLKPFAHEIGKEIIVDIRKRSEFVEGEYIYQLKNRRTESAFIFGKNNKATIYFANVPFDFDYYLLEDTKNNITLEFRFLGDTMVWWFKVIDENTLEVSSSKNRNNILKLTRIR